MLNTKPVKWIGVEMGWGAQRHETAYAPSVLRQKLHLEYANTIASRVPIEPGKTLSYDDRFHEVQWVAQALMQVVAQCISHNTLPIVLGGDDSIGIGTWSGLIAAQAKGEKVGLIWVDAHMDAHTSQTSPSMAIHGMPLGVLLGYGEKVVTVKGEYPRLDPEHVILIGVRSYEAEEAELLRAHRVKIYFMDEVKQRGIIPILREAVDYVTSKTVGFGLNIDLDAFDPTLAPGVGSPEPDGIDNLPEALEALQYATQHPALQALAITEYNPTRDHADKTLDVVKGILSLIAR